MDNVVSMLSPFWTCGRPTKSRRSDIILFFGPNLPCTRLSFQTNSFTAMSFIRMQYTNVHTQNAFEKLQTWNLFKFYLIENNLNIYQTKSICNASPYIGVINIFLRCPRRIKGPRASKIRRHELSLTLDHIRSYTEC